MKLPRFLHKIYAYLNSYFWLPCPICGHEFGGHEWRGGDSLKQIESPVSFGVCKNCAPKAAEWNAHFNGHHALEKEPSQEMWVMFTAAKQAHEKSLEKYGIYEE